MSAPLVVLDADVLGRQRTGDESYVSALLAELPTLAPEIRFAAVTRRVDRVPEGVEPIERWRISSTSWRRDTRGGPSSRSTICRSSATRR